MIYRVINNINGKVYIGQTCQTLYERKLHHKSDAKTKKYNSNFLSAIRKYGLENFTWECLEDCINDDLNDREIFWISKYRKIKNCYNIQDGGQPNIKQKLRPVNAYTEDGNVFGKYNSIKEASLNTDTNRSTISLCLSGKRKSAGKANGMRLIWVNNGEDPPKKPNRWRQGISVDAYTEDNEFIGSFKTAIEGAEFFGLSTQGSVMRSVRDNNRYAGVYNGKKVYWNETNSKTKTNGQNHRVN